LLLNFKTDLDPNFSVLVGDPKATCGKGKKGGANKKLIEILVPVIVGAAILVALGIIFAPRYEKKETKRKQERKEKTEGKTRKRETTKN
jgi:hypothetical protein